MFHSVPIYDSLHSVPIYYVYILPVSPLGSLYTLHITLTTYSCTNTAHVGLLLLGPPPRHGGEGTIWLGGREGVAIPAHIYETSQ